MSGIGTFPFGQPILPVVQRDKTAKQVFVLGVYASAVHARWVGPDGKLRINALAVASEPEIFWGGDKVEEILRQMPLPEGAGRLEPASSQFNGPSGRALDGLFLAPLGLCRHKAWLCDLVPHSCMNERQAQAMERLGLPKPQWPTVPKKLADEQRRSEIEVELHQSAASVLITLGDQPLRWFTKYFGSEDRLGDYGETAAEYGRLHAIRVGDHDLRLLPLVHPRQADKLGNYSPLWWGLHERWRREVAPQLL